LASPRTASAIGRLFWLMPAAGECMAALYKRVVSAA
jgi:hypothetical protein